MAPKLFTVVLDNPNGVFFPGQIVRGLVLFEHSKTVTTTGIYVEARGVAKVHFTRTRSTSDGDSSNTVTDHYVANEKYFKVFARLYDEDGEKFDLRSDQQHRFPFEFTLPDQLPSSFEGKYGHVRYFVKAVVQRSWLWNYEYKIGFTVNTIVDLNISPDATLPTKGTQSKTLGLFGGSAITANAWLDHIGYVPGETIYFNAELHNPKNKAMRGSKVQLVEHTIFHAMGATEKYSRVLVEQSREKFAGPDVWDKVPIVVPPVAPSNLPLCKIIEIAYRIHYIVDPGSLARNLVVPLNILVGNVPLRESIQHFRKPSTRRRNSATASYVLDDPHSEWPSNPLNSQCLDNGQQISDEYPDLPPPTYEECMFQADIRDEKDCKNINSGAPLTYTPRYALYRQK